MVYKKDYQLTDLDKAFIRELDRVKKDLFGDLSDGKGERGK